ncbi:hypothetical protein KSP40_PGU022231 [Platanthera guangdongensis]|uniref:Transmembrane protein n=1 Tax=Platanthera guangdongensis TaxID=2320717 RepID=A0ABR2MWM0_9ASPA
MEAKTGQPAAMETKQSETAVASFSAPANNSGRKPAVLKKKSKGVVRFAEIVGTTTAECAAICCCIPCGILNLVILATVKLPAFLCCRVGRKRAALRPSKKKPAIGGSESISVSFSDGSSKAGLSAGVDDGAEFSRPRQRIVSGGSWPVRSPSVEVVEQEEKVWSKFSGSGFWRTPSQREAR